MARRRHWRDGPTLAELEAEDAARREDQARSDADERRLAPLSQWEAFEFPGWMGVDWPDRPIQDETADGSKRWV
jgi:hypothetical protein